MKSVKTDKSCEQTITYPCLMEGNSSGVIVLFSEYGKGVIVYKGKHVYDIGHIDLSEKYFGFSN